MKKIRHAIVKMLAPTLYKGHLLHEQKVNRPMFEAIRKTKNRGLVGAEIGVEDGFNALRILETLDIKKLFLIDPFVNYRDGDGRRVEVRSKYNQARKRLTKYKNTEFIKKISHEAAPLLPPLDFVYIDGNHSFRNVSQDLLDYYPLIKHGGFIGGHDLFGRYQGVIWAVLNFAVTNDLKLYTAFYDYWFIKGNKFLFPKNP
ncbi:class I SAM-dependent methyltransferase [Candidatus Bathyarchaeota archaeon]|nr:class I SAM-dependent methyltransferase [Candidatus Bathyarchaeota archaeon]